ncbi:PAS domain-containing protein [bacterium]
MAKKESITILDLSKHFNSEPYKAEIFDMLISGIENSSDIVIITDTNGIVQYVNTIFEKITGYTTKEIIGQNMKLLCSGKQDKDFYENMWATIKKGSIWQGSIINKNKQELLYYQEMTIIPIKKGGSKISNFVAFQRDLTDAVGIEKELTIKNKELTNLTKIRNRMISIIKNEFLKPFLHIQEFINIILEEKADDISDDVRAYLGICNNNIERISRLIQDLQRVPKMKTTDIVIQLEYADIEPIIQQVINILKPSADEKNVSIILENQSNIHKLYIDTEKIKSVMRCLLVNALKRSVPSHEVNIYIKEKNGFIEINVQDIGQNITPDCKDIIFNHQENSVNNSANYEDYSTNLAVCKDIIEQHNGRIWIQTNREHGNTFTFKLPIEKRTQTR